MVENVATAAIATVVNCPFFANVDPNQQAVISLKKDDDTILTPGGKGRERRVHKRVYVALKVLVVSGNEVFACTSLNVSIGGLQLSKAIPGHFLTRECRVLISSSDNKLQVGFGIKVVDNSERGARLRFDDNLDIENQRKLELWISANFDDVAA